MSSAIRPYATFLGTPALWTVRVLAWVAFLVSGYLAWTSVGHVPIAGCAGTGLFNCDAVHNSSWSMWFSLPVALAGLACYAVLAGLSVVASLDGLAASRWIRTSLFMVSAVAGGAALWFTFLQFAVIGSICPVCMLVHLCGVTIAGIVIWTTLRLPATAGPPRLPHAGMAALRVTLPVSAKSTPRAAPQPDDRPLVGLALCGAMGLMAILIGGQILFPAKTYDVQAVELDKTINLGDAANDQPALADVSTEPHVAMRVTDDAASNQIPTNSSLLEKATDDAAESTGDHDGGSNLDATAGSGTADGGPVEPSSGGRSSDAPLSGERIVKLLRGKLSLDVYKQPVLGSPVAPSVLVELISYDCPHCRKTHPIVEQGRKRYGDQLAVVVLPVPLDQKCNRLVTTYNPEHKGSCALARHALAVAAVNPGAFEQYHEWLMSGDRAPSAQKAMEKAYSLVGRERVIAAAYSDSITKRISENVELFATLQQQHSSNRNFGLPVQIMKNGVMSGSTVRSDDVYRTWEEHLGLKPLAVASKRELR